MSSESVTLAKIWCMPAPKEPVAKALHAGCLAYLESTGLAPRKKSKVSEIRDLPAEMHFQVIGNLPYVDRMRLRATSRFYRNTIPALTTHEELLAAELEDHCKAKDLLACRLCLRLRSISKFADPMRKGRRGRNGLQRHKRFCLDCGIQKKHYAICSWVVIDNRRYRICPECLKPKKPNSGLPDRPLRELASALQKSRYDCANCAWGKGMRAILDRDKARKERREKKAWLKQQRASKARVNVAITVCGRDEAREREEKEERRAGIVKVTLLTAQAARELVRMEWEENEDIALKMRHSMSQLRAKQTKLACAISKLSVDNPKENIRTGLLVRIGIMKLVESPEERSQRLLAQEERLALQARLMKLSQEFQQLENDYNNMYPTGWRSRWWKLVDRRKIHIPIPFKCDEWVV